MSFVRNDEKLLIGHFNVESFYFNQSQIGVSISFIKHFFSLLVNLPRTQVYISFFAGYSSFLPAVFAKITKRPHLIILGGTDCSNFPEINYGNYRKVLLGAATRYSIRQSTHLAPVDRTLIDCKYEYFPVNYKNQGFLSFCNNPDTPVTVINIGYDASKFYCKSAKKPNSFLTVGQMNTANYFRKGIDLIFEIAPLFPAYSFTIVGDTPGMDYGTVPDNITILPFVPYDELTEIYSSHEFYLQLSIMEGFPSALCEAMLCECIPIVSAVGAMPQIVGESGFVLEKKSLPDLADLVKKAINSNKVYLAKRARQQIEINYPISTRLQLINLVTNMCKIKA